MGIPWPAVAASKKPEIIHAGDIRYKEAEINEVSANVIGTSAIILNKVTLLAAVGATRSSTCSR